MNGTLVEREAETRRLVVALVRGVHGLRGAVRVEVLTDLPAERFEVGRALYREGDDRPLTIVAGVQEHPGWRLQFAEIGDRDGAEALQGSYLEADVAPASGDAPGSYYWHDVVGAKVRDLDGNELGTVVDVYRVAENEVFVVSGGPGGEFDLPAVRSFIRTFDPRGEGIVVDAEALDLRPSSIAARDGKVGGDGARDGARRGGRDG